MFVRYLCWNRALCMGGKKLPTIFLVSWRVVFGLVGSNQLLAMFRSMGLGKVV
jgi:hypothetical protein